MMRRLSIWKTASKTASPKFWTGLGKLSLRSRSHRPHIRIPLNINTVYRDPEHHLRVVSCVHNDAKSKNPFNLHIIQKHPALFRYFEIWHLPHPLSRAVLGLAPFSLVW